MLDHDLIIDLYYAIKVHKSSVSVKKVYNGQF